MFNKASDWYVVANLSNKSIRSKIHCKLWEWMLMIFIYTFFYPLHLTLFVSSAFSCFNSAQQLGLASREDTIDTNEILSLGLMLNSS